MLPDTNQLIQSERGKAPFFESGGANDRTLRLNLILAATGVFAALIAAAPVFGQADVPESLNRQSIKLGAGLVTRSVFLHDARLGEVTDIIFDPTAEAKFGVAGLQGAVFLKGDLSPASRVQFTGPGSGLLGLLGAPPRFSEIQFVHLDKKRGWGYLDRGGHGWQNAALLGPDGRTLWTYGENPDAVDDMAAGDLDGDGVVDFVVGFNGGSGIRRLDVAGKKRWQQPDGNVWHVEIVDANGDGKPEIVHTNARGEITIRDPDGKVLRKFKTGIYCSQFSLCHWPSPQSAPKLATERNGTLALLDLLGGIAARYPIPAPKSPDGVRAAAVRLKKGEPPYLAALMIGRDWRGEASILYLFNARREAVYREDLAGRCAALKLLPAAEPGLDEFLVGGPNVVWKYKPGK